MTDEGTENVMQPGVYDDDRLLACALGLDEDPELLAAAAADAALAARLAAIRGDVAAVEAQVAAAVPPPDASYTDLAGEQWGGLSEFFEPPARAAKPRRAGRWWRVAAPIAALTVLALVVGIVAVDRGSQSGPSSSQSTVVEGAASSAGSGDASDKALPVEPAAQGFAEQLDRFAIVVLARARTVSGALQRFAVVRIFKGEAPQVVLLEVDGEPADQGRLHLLMLDPVATAPGESPVPEPYAPSTTKGDAGAPGRPLAVAYTYQGEPTVVRELAAGTDPDTVSLQIP